MSMISILSDIPESLHEVLQHYLDLNQTWDVNQFMTVAIATLLSQTGDEAATQILQELGREGRHED